MSPWSARRKLIYGGIFTIFVASILFFIFYSVLYKEPTCFDNKQNGTETGVDCGGACTKVCKAELLPPRVVWSRVFEVDEGVYNAAAYLENPNINAEAKDVPYVFRLFDEENILVYERKGKLDIPPQTSFAIFETNIQTGNRTPRFTFFEFEKEPLWKSPLNIERSEDYLRVKTQNFETKTNISKLSAVIENTSFIVIRDIELVAILYDKSGNAVAVSRTVLDSVPAEGVSPVVFTWPKEILDASRFEIIPAVR